jgi:hypothetical protein
MDADTDPLQHILKCDYLLLPYIHSSVIAGVIPQSLQLHA